jgi:hypothetical protein
MKKLFLFCTLICLSALALAQQPSTATQPVDTSWKKGGFINVNFSQVSLDRWAQGGENSLALSGSLNLFANYAKDKTTWDNNLDLAYAILKSGPTPSRKSDDKIDFTSKFGRKISTHWSYSALFNFKSQFTKGFKYPDDSNVVSKFLAPGYVTLALGFNYKPVDYFEVFISPATGRLTIVNDDVLANAGAYGVKPGEKTRMEFGAYLNMKFKKDIMENVTLMTKLELFDNYSDDNGNNRKNVDVNWETSLNMKVNKFITASIATQLIYDHDVIKHTQFKEVVGVGLGYKF